MSMDAGGAGLRLRGYQAPVDLALFSEMLADYGADRLGQIVHEGFKVLEEHLAVLRRVAAKPDMAAADVEECARLLQFLRMEANDAGFRGFADACRIHERRARRGIAPAKADAEALASGCRAARDRMEQLLG